MNKLSPYGLAEKTVTHVRENCEKLYDKDGDRKDPSREKVRVLNYLRTVRTTIELLEHEILGEYL